MKTSIEEIPNHDVKTRLTELDKQSNADEFKEKATFESDFRFEAGYTKLFVTMPNKEEFRRAIYSASLHLSLSETNQFIDGLKICNILQLVPINKILNILICSEFYLNCRTRS